MKASRDLREIASYWHGGQSSPLYKLSSSGTPVSGLVAEINGCILFATTEDERESLIVLLEWAEANEPQLLRCPECGHEVWDIPTASKLAKCWNALWHASNTPIVFDTMSYEPDE